MKNRFLRFTFVVFLSSLTSFLMASDANGGSDQMITKKRMNSQEYLSKVRSNQISGEISVSDVMNAREATQKLMSSNKSAFSWTSFGPNNMGGPTKAVIFDNRDASNNTLYAGSNSGGLWMSNNYGSTWEKVSISEVLNVSSIAQAENGTIYVGTGVSLEPAADKISEGSTIGKGIWKSNGSSFELMAGTAPSGQDLDGEWAFIQKLAVDGSGHLYAATNTGLKYFDGTSWSYAMADGAELTGKSCDVVYGGGSVFAVVAGNAYVSSGAYNAFTMVSGEEDGMLPVGSFGNIKLAIAPSNGDYMYASYVNTNGAIYNTYASTDKGVSWRIIYPGGSSLNDIFNGEGLRNNAIAVHPTDEKKIYLGAYNVFEGYEAQPTGYYSWSQKTNGEFNPYPTFGTSSYAHFGINTIVFNPSTPSNVIIGTDGGMSITKDAFSSLQLLNRGYVTSEYFTINASKAGDVLAGAQFNGLHKILNNGSNQAFELIYNNYGGPSYLTGGHAHISYINPDFIVVSAEDGTFWRSEDGGENVNADITNGITLGAEFITPFAIWETTNLEFTYDTAEFTAYGRDYAAGEQVWVRSNTYDFPFQYTLPQNVDSAQTLQMMDPVGTKSFIAVEGEASSQGFNGGVYMTLGMLDYTATPVWWQIGAVEGIPTCLAYSKDANYVWVGTVEGRLFRLSNIARATTEAKADITSPGCIIAITEITLPTTQAITSLAVDQSDAENVMVTMGNYGNSDYVFLSTDGMADSPLFESVQGNLPQMPVYSSTFILNGSSAFVGTENGLFHTSNIFASTVSWNFESAPFGDVPVFALKQQSLNWPNIGYYIGSTWISYPGAENFGALYVGTFGNGAYVSMDFVGFEEFEDQMIETNLLTVYPNPAVNMASVHFYANSSSSQIEVYDMAGKLVMKTVEETQFGDNTIELDVTSFEKGTYLIRLISGQTQSQAKLIISK